VRQAAHSLDISHGYLSELEHGRRCPSLVVACVLVERLALDPGVGARLLAVARPNAGRSWREERDMELMAPSHDIHVRRNHPYP
jgi:hypothetical protein